MMKSNIDVVILWVDGNDEKWKKEKAKYMTAKFQDAKPARYRDWETLKYLFRGIEKYASWVNKVHLVTCGHYPKWLNFANSKLNFVKHEDFIPKEFLPTFSSSGIDLHLHRIEGLSEKFIYFNDDMFLTNYVKTKDFFRKDMPCDMFSERPIFTGDNIFNHVMINNIQILSKRFERKKFLKNNWKKVINPKYGFIFFYNLIWSMFPFKKFCGIAIHHLPTGYRKSIFEEVWQLEEKVLTDTASNKFRTVTDVNQFIFNFWALLKGEFAPLNMSRQGKCFNIIDSNNKNLYKEIRMNRNKRICINDNCSEEIFLAEKSKLIESFEVILPEKSSFER